VSIVTIALPNIQRKIPLDIGQGNGFLESMSWPMQAFSYWGDVLLTCLVIVASFSWEPRQKAWPPSPLDWHTTAGC